MKNIPARLTELRTLLRYHNQKYHIEDNPEISDRAYDDLFQELKDLEQQYPEFITPDSPTQKLLIAIQKDFKQAEHKKPLLSLDNTYNAEELREFDVRCKKLAEKEMLSYVVEQKYDGLSIAVTYVDGVFSRAATRGDGKWGEDVTENIKTIGSIPQSLQEKIPFLEVRGEVLMTKEIFERLNVMRMEEGSSLFANPRNAAAGAIRQLDPNITASRKLDAIFYDITYSEGLPTFTSHSEELQFLREKGLKVAEDMVCKDMEEVIELSKKMEEMRNDHPFEVDGMVIKVDDVSLYETMGYTEHHPRFAIAYKFKAQEEITKLEDIIIQVGRTGVLTPVAILAPVQLAGVSVSRASLHNMDEVAKLDIRVGDYVLVKRAGEVIPKVIKTIPERRNGSETIFSIPTHCPVCHAHAIRLPEEVAYRCPNLSCPAQIGERLKYFVSKEAMDIDGLGEKYIEAFVSGGLIKTFVDIYYLKDRLSELLPLLYEPEKVKKITEEGLVQQDIFGTATVSDLPSKTSLKLLKNLLSSIEASKEKGIDRIFTGMGIKYIGKKTARTITEHVQSLWDLVSMTKEELENIPGVGAKSAESVFDYMQQEENRELLRQLETVGFSFMKKVDVSRNQAGALSGMTILFTGTLTTMTRPEASERAAALGASIADTLTKQVTHLVVGEKAGSKLEKAKKMQITILTEDEFLNLVEKIL